jgi:hypothetical protein
MRYLATKAGTAHVVLKDSPCPVVKKNVDSWKGQRSLKPSVVLEGYRDCAKCQTFKHARLEQKVPAASRPVAEAKRPAKQKARDVTPMVANGDNWPVADERTTAKAKEHMAIAEEHGWSVTVTSNNRRGLTVIASREDEICVLAYRENGILWNDEIVFKVPGRIVPMHNSGTWRRQVSLPEGKRPIPARPKRFGRKPAAKVANGPESAEEVSPDGTEVDGELIPLNKSSLPFPIDADDLVIIDYIKGRTLYWRNNMMAKVVSANVPSKPRLIRFGETRRGRRFVSFPESTMTKDGEMWGAERSVAIEDMLRVR